MASRRKAPITTYWDHLKIAGLSEDGFLCLWKNRPIPYHHWHTHVGWELLLCTEGEGVYFLGDRRIPYSAGSLILFNAQVPHRLEMSSNYRRWNILVWPARLDGGESHQPLFQQLIQDKLHGGAGFHIRVSDRDFARLHQLLGEMHEEWTGKRKGYKQFLQLHLAELLLWIDRRSSESAATLLQLPPSGINDTTAAVLSYIEANLASELTVAGLAKRFHISTSHLYRLMSQRLGQTPLEYIRSRRIERAKHLLASTDLTVNEIATAVGASTGTNLSRLFRNETGQSPTQYRKSVRESTSTSMMPS